MDNPYQTKRDCVYTILETEHEFTKAAWNDVMSLDVSPGKKFIIVSINISTTSHVNAGFRFVDDDDTPFQPYRTKTDNREPTHFSFEPPTQSDENLTVVTFHMVAEAKKKVRLQIRADDSGKIRVNGIVDQRNKPYNHKTISTMSVISL